MIAAWFALGLALASPPRGAVAPPPLPTALAGLQVTPAPIDAQEQYAAWRVEAGLPPDALACDALWPGTALRCFRVAQGGSLRWLTSAEVERLGVGLTTLTAHARAEAPAALASGLREVRVAGLEGSYWLAESPSAAVGAGLLDPAALSALVPGKGPLAVAAPTTDVLVAWRVGTPDLDKAVAVGLYEMFDRLPGSVSPRAYIWDGKAWTPWGQARPAAQP